MQFSEITPLPDAPVEGEAVDVFNVKASRFVAGLSTLVDELNALIEMANRVVGGIEVKEDSFSAEANKWYSCPGGIIVSLEEIQAEADDFVGLIPDASWDNDGPIVQGQIEGSTEEMQLNQTRAAKFIYRNATFGWVRS